MEHENRRFGEETKIASYTGSAHEQLEAKSAQVVGFTISHLDDDIRADPDVKRPVF